MNTHKQLRYRLGSTVLIFSQRRCFVLGFLLLIFTQQVHAELSTGQRLQGEIEIGGMAFFSFTAQANEAVYISVVDLEKEKGFEPMVWLYGPSGSLIERETHGLVARLNCHSRSSQCQLKKAGTYKVVIADRSGINPGRFRVEFISISGNAHLVDVQSEISGETNKRSLTKNKGSIESGEQIRHDKLVQTTQTNSKQAASIETILPLNSTWAQSGHYSLNINTDKNISPCVQDAYVKVTTDKKYLSGCAAVAVSQIINYHLTREKYQDGWLDRILDNVDLYPRPWAKGSSIRTLRLKNPACTAPNNWDTLNSYPNSIDINNVAQAKELLNFIWRVGIGLDLDYTLGLSTDSNSITGIKTYVSEPRVLLAILSPQYPFDNSAWKIVSLLEKRFKFKGIGHSKVISDLNSYSREIVSSIEDENPLLLSLQVQGKKLAHMGIIYGYRKVSESSAGQYEFLINMGAGDTDGSNDTGSNKWYSGDGAISSIGYVFDKFVVSAVRPIS